MLVVMTQQTVALLQEAVWQYYARNGRTDLPWRQSEADGSLDPYKILVSEVMLQQTQVPRVIPKFTQFLQLFPDVAHLAQAPLSDVLKAWSGLGYNRRAKFLWEAARTVMREYDGQLPASHEELIKLPGIGANTAGAILVYAYNQPEVFIETNIRTVFIYHFFADQKQVTDKELSVLVAETLPSDDPRNWYWALMDYGTFLKQSAGNASRQSKHFVRQSRFEGSRRQIRGKVLKLLATQQATKAQLVAQIADERLMGVLEDLQNEGFIVQNGTAFTLREMCDIINERL